MLAGILQMPSFTQCAHVWSYAGKSFLIARNLLNASARSGRIKALAGKNFSDQVKTITTHMKLLSIVSVPFSLMDLHMSIQKAWKSLKANDKTGLTLNALSSTILVLDILDSMSTFVNAALGVMGRELNAPLSALGLPMAFTMLGIGSMTRVIHIFKTKQLNRKMSMGLLANISILAALILFKRGNTSSSPFLLTSTGLTLRLYLLP